MNKKEKARKRADKINKIIEKILLTFLMATNFITFVIMTVAMVIVRSPGSIILCLGSLLTTIIMTIVWYEAHKE